MFKPFVKRIYLDIWIYRIHKFDIGIYYTLSDAIDIILGYWCIVIFYKPEDKNE